MKNKADKLFNFITNLKIENTLPVGVDILNPYKSEEVIDINHKFYYKYYNDSYPRILLLGINPGRFGAGVTGIPFTDPIILEEQLNIKNSFEKKAELSASFIYMVIKEYGGAEKFFRKFLLSAMSPLGFIKNGININYYDLKELETSVATFISDSLIKQHEITGKKDIAVCIGQGTNLKYLTEMNNKLGLFKQIYKLGHPRWIMQYKRKKLGSFIKDYVELLKSI
ncbi:MAG: DUF4918 family protein [Bacteroidales bacterium]|nr:DUF4918 family protein [Bacteroidales bacterium]